MPRRTMRTPRCLAYPMKLCLSLRLLCSAPRNCLFHTAWVWPRRPPKSSPPRHSPWHAVSRMWTKMRCCRTSECALRADNRIGNRYRQRSDRADCRPRPGVCLLRLRSPTWAAREPPGGVKRWASHHSCRPGAPENPRHKCVLRHTTSLPHLRPRAFAARLLSPFAKCPPPPTRAVL